MLQCVAVCCSVLQFAANDVIRFQMTTYAAKEISAGDELFVCYKTGGGLLQFVAVRCSVLQCVAACCSVLQLSAMRLEEVCSFCVCCSV